MFCILVCGGGKLDVHCFNSEWWWADPVDWHSIRGPQMIILMKMVSVGFDLDSSSLSKLPSLLEMAGYIMNPGTVIFGPWVSFSTYKRVLQPMSWVSLELMVADDVCFFVFLMM